MIRTVVSHGNDALNLLFEAATQDSRASHQSDIPRHAAFDPAGDHVTSTSPALSRAPDQGPSAAPDVLELWRCSRYVRMGWLSAEEAILYIDL